MMSFALSGVDYSRTGTQDWIALAAALKAQGMQFAGRYAVTDKAPSGRGITAPEYQALIAADLAVFLYWEGIASWMLGGYNAGVQAAQNAVTNIAAAGMPAGMPVYFSHDIDPLASDFPAIDACLSGAAAVVGLPRVGVYGGWLLIDHCASVGNATYLAQTVAWEYGRGVHPAAHLSQYDTSGTTIGETDCDLVHALQPHYGQASDFLVPPVPLAVGVSAAVTATSLNLRNTPSLAGVVLGQLTAGAVVMILAGPQSADGYHWYQVKTANGSTVWCAGDYLIGVRAPEPPAIPVTTTTTTTTTVSPFLVKPEPISGPVQDQTLRGTSLYAFQHDLKVGPNGAQPTQHGVTGSSPTGPVLKVGSSIKVDYLFNSASEGDWWVIDTIGNRLRLQDLVS